MPDRSMIEALDCRPPARDPGPERMLFARFIGEWDVLVSYRREDGTETRTGEWLFGWVLEGMAVQDVWRVPSRAETERTGAPLHGYGTTLRFFDPALGAWRSTWHGLVKGEVIPFIGREAGSEIHLEDRRAFPTLRRWAFSDMEADRFRWRNEASADGGATWSVEQEMQATRRGTSA